MSKGSIGAEREREEGETEQGRSIQEGPGEECHAPLMPSIHEFEKQ